LNYSGTIEIRSALTGNHKNAGVERYNSLNQQHLEPVTEIAEDGTILLVVKTTQSDILVATACHTALSVEATPKISSDHGWIQQEYAFEAHKDREVALEKMVAMYTSRDPGVEDPLDEARSAWRS
jgi:trehalose/maltose hydrolase-like predicted phosphorylase